MMRQTQPRIFATVLLLFSCLVFLAACSISIGTGGGGTTSGNGNATATPSGPSATDILNRAKQAALKDATFTFALNANSATGAAALATTGNGRLTTNPARTDLQLPALNIFGSTLAAEVINDQATNTYYVTAAFLNGQWVKLDPAVLGVNIGVVAIVNYDGLQNPTYVGTETINAISTYHVQGTKQISATASAGSASITRTEDLWFRQSDYFPVKLMFQDVANGTVSGTPTPGVGTSTPTATPGTGTPTPTATITLPGSIAHDATATPTPTTTATAMLTETFTFSAWNGGFTIALPTNIVSLP